MNELPMALKRNAKKGTERDWENSCHLPENRIPMVEKVGRTAMIG